MYDIYVFHRSYFCGKMLAYLRYKQIPFRAIYGSLGQYGAEIQANTGLRQMPVIRTPEGHWLNDTTPMIDWFEERYPTSPLVPEDPVVGFLSRLLEDYADEWLWRPAIYYRWAFADDRKYYKRMFVKEFLGAPWTLARPLTWLAGQLVHRHQNQKFLWGDGMTRKNREHIEGVYTGTLDRLQAIFERQAFLLGGRPSLADFGFFGSMFYHFSNDPTPNRIMQDRAPAVYEWVARLWNAKQDRLADRSCNFTPGQAPDLWSALLRDVCENYLPYLHTNARAFAAGERRFDWQVQGYEYPGVHVSPYRVWCRERLYRHLRALSETAQRDILAILEGMGVGGREALIADQDIASQWDPENIAPLCRPAKIPLRRRLLAPFVGSNHIRTVRAWR